MQSGNVICDGFPQQIIIIHIDVQSAGDGKEGNPRQCGAYQKDAVQRRHLAGGKTAARKRDGGADGHGAKLHSRKRPYRSRTDRISKAVLFLLS